MTKRGTKEHFIRQSVENFGDIIDHSLTEYNGWDKKAVLYCKEHGRFEVNPHTHLLSKHGCTKCGAVNAAKIHTEKKRDSFLSDARKVHGDTYTYNKMKYINTREKIEITCSKHASFWQSPQKHLSGQGCPDCARYGYNTARPGNFYILQSGDITKVGITHQKVSQRIWQIHKSTENKFKIKCEMFFQDGMLPRVIEKACLIYLKLKYQNVPEVFDGSTECFLNVDLDDLILFVLPLATTEFTQVNQ